MKTLQLELTDAEYQVLSTYACHLELEPTAVLRNFVRELYIQVEELPEGWHNNMTGYGNVVSLSGMYRNMKISIRWDRYKISYACWMSNPGEVTGKLCGYIGYAKGSCIQLIARAKTLVDQILDEV